MATWLNGTERTLNRDVTAFPQWFVFDLELATTAEDVQLMKIHEGTVIDDVYAVCLVAENGGTTSGIDLEGTNQAGVFRTIWAGGATSMETTGRIAGTLTVAQLGPSTDAQAPEYLNLEYTTTGTSTTAPQVRLCVLMHRLTRPGADPASTAA